MDDGDTYQKPADGWVCFHCGDRFTTEGSARDHFGVAPSDDPACRIKVGAERGILMALRKAEAELARCRADDTDAVRRLEQCLREQQGRHADALRDAEELGYERGLADGLKLATT